MTPAEVESARELKRAGASWRDLALRYGRDERTLRRTVGKKLWPDDGPHEPSSPLNDRGPEHGAVGGDPEVGPVPTPAPEAVRFAPPSTPPERTDLERILIIPDTHVPYEDGQAFAVMMAAARVFRPDLVILLGDFADCYAVSFHPKSPARRASLKEELEAVNARLDEIQSLGARVVYIEGNHEHRLERWLADRAPELYGMIEAEALFRIEERGWSWVPYRQHHKVGKMHFTHDVGHAGIYAHRQSRMAYEGNVVIGHCHRLSMEVAGTSKGPAHVGIALGWLGDKAAIDYLHQTKAAQWALAFGLAYHERDTGNVHVVPVPIVDYRCIVEGQLIDPFRGTSADTMLKRAA